MGAFNPGMVLTPEALRAHDIIILSLLALSADLNQSDLLESRFEDTLPAHNHDKITFGSTSCSKSRVGRYPRLRYASPHSVDATMMRLTTSR